MSHYYFNAILSSKILTMHHAEPNRAKQNKDVHCFRLVKIAQYKMS